MSEKAKAITTLIVDALIVFNMAAQAFGWTPVAYDQAVIYAFISAALTVAATLWTWWKNQNVTQAAAQAQHILEQIKAEGKSTK